MPRGSGLPEDIYAEIVARLIEKLPECQPETCYFSLNENALPSSPGDVTFVVAPMGGKMLEGYYEGGGLEQLNVNAGVIVKIHSPLQLDEAGKDIELLTHATMGLWRLSRRVIRFLADPEWSPMKGDNEITRDPLIPLGYDITKGRKKSRSLGGIELHFAVNFDWDVLSTAGEAGD